MLDLMSYSSNTQTTYYYFGNQQWNEELADDVVTYLKSGLHLFSFDADLFETTFYVTTRH